LIGICPSGDFIGVKVSVAIGVIANRWVGMEIRYFVKVTDAIPVKIALRAGSIVGAQRVIEAKEALLSGRRKSPNDIRSAA
jgi:ammonia channel protein AmtB